MELWMEGALCVLCVLGLCALGWVLLGRLLRPIPARNVRLVIAGRGAGEELEQTVRGLMWLRGLGLLSCPVVIADVDLTPQGTGPAPYPPLARPGPVAGIGAGGVHLSS